MRITGGKYVRKRVECPKGEIRPAMDRMRESMFHILGPIEGLSFLDLFSGSGIVGIEAASRGCSPVYCVEKDKGKKRTLLKNISVVDTEIRAYFVPVERYIMTARKQFDIVFLDPPFRYPYKEELLKRLGESRVLKETSICILHLPKGDFLTTRTRDTKKPGHTSAENDVSERSIGRLTLYEERKFGRSFLLFFTPKEVNGQS